MIRRSTLSFLLAVCTFSYSKFSFAITYVDYGSSTNYTLNAGDSLFIASGTYTGAISGLNSNTAKITVNSGATFQPSGFPNNAIATMNVYGTAIFDYNIRTNSNFILNNYGIFSVSGTTLINGSNQVWTNSYGGVMNFYSNVTMNGDLGNNNTLINYENINCTGTFQMNSGSSCYNYNDFAVTGTFRINGGTFQNEGKLDVTGNILMNNGASVIRNYCSMQATAGITNTSGNFYNYSFVWAINSDISNSANIINAVSNHSTPMIQGRNYTHSTGATMTGPCLLYFDGTTTLTGGTVGVAGVTSDTIKMNDVTRSVPTQIFDVQSGGTL